MNKYIRTKWYTIEEVIRIENSNVFENTAKYFTKQSRKNPIFEDFVLAKGDSISDVLIEGDLLIFSNGQNKLPVILEDINYTKKWMWAHDLYQLKEIYCKTETDYKLLIKINDKGEVEII